MFKVQGGGVVRSLGIQNEAREVASEGVLTWRLPQGNGSAATRTHTEGKHRRAGYRTAGKKQTRDHEASTAIWGEVVETQRYKLHKLTTGHKRKNHRGARMQTTTQTDETIQRRVGGNPEAL